MKYKLWKLPSCGSILKCYTLIGPRQAKKSFRACAKFVQSLIGGFALHWNILKCPITLFADSKDSDLGFAVRICQRICSRMARPSLFDRKPKKTTNLISYAGLVSRIKSSGLTIIRARALFCIISLIICCIYPFGSYRRRQAILTDHFCFY